MKNLNHVVMDVYTGLGSIHVKLHVCTVHVQNQKSNYTGIISIMIPVSQIL